MNNWIEEVKKFQDIFESKYEDTQELINLRRALVDEEIYELWEGLHELSSGLEFNNKEQIKHGKIETLDAIADSIVVLIGTATALHLNLDEAMKRVFESNLTKLNIDGRPIYDVNGKVMKGVNYMPPVLDDLV